MSIDRHAEEIKNAGFRLIGGVFSDDYCKKLKAQANDDTGLLRNSRDRSLISASSPAEKA